MNVISFFALKKSMDLPAVIFMKLTNAHKHYAQILYQISSKLDHKCVK